MLRLTCPPGPMGPCCPWRSPLAQPSGSNSGPAHHAWVRTSIQACTPCIGAHDNPGPHALHGCAHQSRPAHHAWVRTSIRACKPCMGAHSEPSTAHHNPHTRSTSCQAVWPTDSTALEQCWTYGVLQGDKGTHRAAQGDKVQGQHRPQSSVGREVLEQGGAGLQGRDIWSSGRLKGRVRICAT